MSEEKSLLPPRVAAKFIAQRSRHVKMLPDGIRQTAHKIFDMMKETEIVVGINRWQLHVLNPKTCDKAAVDWVFLVDLLNFSFWPECGQPKYMVRYAGQEWTGYWSLCAAVNRALDEGIAITDPQVYRCITRHQLELILRSDAPGACMPLIAERLESLHTAGQTLCQKFGGSFTNVIKQCNNSAVDLLQLIVEHFPTFRDTAVYEGQPVAFYKRAQILIADIWSSCGGDGFGSFTDIDEITAFADYRIPQALAWFGAIQYSDSLLQALNNNELLENGEEREVEIRGCTVWAVELIVEELRTLLATTATVNAILIDNFLWDFRRDHASELETIPFHLTRCIYY